MYKKVRFFQAMTMLMTLLVCEGLAIGHDGIYPQPPVRGSIVDVWFEYDNGNTLPIINAASPGGRSYVNKYYIEAIHRENYRIGVRNLTPERVGLVIAVDGRNIVSGDRSDLLSNERKYVIEPWQTLYLDGWRTSSTETHRFYFTTPKESYSVRAFGDRSAMGIIGIAAYREVRSRTMREYDGRDWPAPPESMMDAGRWPSNRFEQKEAAPSSRSKEGDRLGTGFGDSRYSPSYTVSFEPERQPAWKALYKYETRQSLCRQGIIECDGHHEHPNRMWDERGYAPHPGN